MKVQEWTQLIKLRRASDLIYQASFDGGQRHIVSTVNKSGHENATLVDIQQLHGCKWAGRKKEVVGEKEIILHLVAMQLKEEKVNMDGSWRCHWKSFSSWFGLIKAELTNS